MRAARKGGAGGLRQGGGPRKTGKFYEPTGKKIGGGLK